ncbi:MAG: hypothetical protein RMJ36_06270, partial [Candidatus Calescibacterium sp.]|nr:hypothetical protein [Candidatus Calescibacterium sp.]MDW8133241.1 hypothetical protein [Candidatus Calescibacterium sp.]
NANNVYIINNNYNEPVYNNFNNKFYNTYSIPYYNNYYNFYPSFFVTPFFWCYTFPFVPWFPIVLPFMWRW